MIEPTNSSPPTLRLPRRPVDPRQFLNTPDLAVRLQQLLPGAPWDVFTTNEVATALAEHLNPLALNDWHYQRTRYAPPREGLHRWKGNVAYYRKDVLIGWAQSGGRTIAPWNVWQMSANYLSQVLGLRHPWTLRQTEEDIHWALDLGLVTLRARPRLRQFLPFTDDAMAAHPDWGAQPMWPLGSVEAR